MQASLLVLAKAMSPKKSPDNMVVTVIAIRVKMFVKNVTSSRDDPIRNSRS